MSDAVTEVQCRQMQIACSDRQAKEFAALRAAVQDIDRNVAKIMGYLGLNGTPAPPHPHHRDSEESDRLHQRAEDAIVAAEKAIAAVAADKAMQKAAPETNSITIPRWAVYASAALLLIIIILAAVAGERSIPLVVDGWKVGTGVPK